MVLNNFISIIGVVIANKYPTICLKPPDHLSVLLQILSFCYIFAPEIKNKSNKSMETNLIILMAFALIVLAMIVRLWVLDMSHNGKL